MRPSFVALAPRDRERCMDLVLRVGWPREPAKWDLILSLGPAFGAVLADDELAAVVAFPRHEGASFVAMMAVDPRHQGRGLGRALLEHAMAVPEQPLMLYATAEGRPLYERLGFVAVDGAAKHFAPLAAPIRAGGRPGVRVAKADDHAPIIARDAAAFGVRRGALLAGLFAIAERVVVDQRQGFAIRWSNGNVAIVGPVVAQTEDDAIALVDEALAGATGVVRIDVAARSPRVAAHVRALGLVDHGSSPLMTWRQGPLVGDRATYHALALQAFG